MNGKMMKSFLLFLLLVQSASTEGETKSAVEPNNAIIHHAGVNPLFDAAVADAATTKKLLASKQSAN